MEDIAPKLFEKIKSDFEDGFQKSKKIRNLAEKLKSGKSTYRDGHAFAVGVAEILSEAFQNNLSSDVLPDGRLYYNIADRIIRPMLEDDFKIIAEYAAAIQDILNKQAGIGIKSVMPEMNNDKVQGIIDIVSGKEKFDDVAYMLGEPIINFSQAIVDDTVRANADFQYKAGLSPKIIRTATGKCCKWCDNLAGVYEYEKVSDTGNDVFRRHKHCRCLVEYDGNDGKRQNVHTKQKQKKDIMYPTEEQIRKSSKIKGLAFSEAKKRGMNPLSEETAVNILRKESEKWIEQLSNEEKRAIQKYTYNSGDKKPNRFFERLNAMLRGDLPEDERIRDYAERISGALRKNKLNHDIIAYRGMDLDPSEGIPVNGLYRPRQFFSTSVVKGRSFEGKYKIIIFVKKSANGAYIENLSYFKQQRELLLDKDCIYRVLSKERETIVLEVI